MGGGLYKANGYLSIERESLLTVLCIEWTQLKGQNVPLFNPWDNLMSWCKSLIGLLSIVL